MNRTILLILVTLFLPTLLLADGAAFLFLEYPLCDEVLSLPVLYRGVFKDGSLEPTALYRFSRKAIDVEVIPAIDGKLWLYDGVSQLLCLDKFAPHIDWVFSDVSRVISADKRRVVYLTEPRQKKRHIVKVDLLTKDRETLCSVDKNIHLPLQISPDDKKLLYFRRGSKRQLIVRPLGGGKEKTIASMARLPLLSSKKKPGNQALWLNDKEVIVVTQSRSEIFPFALERWSINGKRLQSEIVRHKGLAYVAELSMPEKGLFELDLGRSYQFAGARLKAKEIKKYKRILLRERANHYRVKRVSIQPKASKRVAWLFPKRRPVNTIGEQLIVYDQISPCGRYSLLGLTDIGGRELAKRCALLDRKSRNLLTVKRGKGPVRPVCWLPLGQGLQ